MHSGRDMKAIQIHQTGGPEVLQVAELPIPEPGPGQVLIRVEATGVNFIEIYFRKGVYKSSLPLVPGSEAAGTIEELGPGVTGFKAGDAVASSGNVTAEDVLHDTGMFRPRSPTPVMPMLSFAEPLMVRLPPAAGVIVAEV